MTIVLLIIIILLLYGCSVGETEKPNEDYQPVNTEITQERQEINKDTESEKEYIERILNLQENDSQEWTYSKDYDAWTLTPVTAVAYPEIADQQGVSVCVPGAYIKGIDTNGDGAADVMFENANSAVKGALVIDYETEMTSTNGQVYTAPTAPVILNTGAAGYGSQKNMSASGSHAGDGYINVVCGNRGKQDSAEDEEGNSYYTGDAPSCLADQKAAARYVKYNIILGNLPGNVDYFVSTGGSGGGAHAVIFAATSNNPDFYDYQIESGAVGVYKNEDGTYSTAVNIDGAKYEISDGAWGSVAYSAITSLYEADMALAFEYNLNSDYEFKTPLQAKVAEYLSQSYREYINGKNLSIDESVIEIDINKDGDKEDIISLKIEYNPLSYIGAPGTENPVWTKIIMGANEEDIALMNSINKQIAWLDADTDSVVEWQWDAGHVPSEILGESFSLYVDQMYGEYVEGSRNISKPEAKRQTQNGTMQQANGADRTDLINYDDLSNVGFSLKDIAAYRTSGANKATPAFDVIDYAQEDYVFGNSQKDARHWDKFLLDVFEKCADELEPLFNAQ